MKLLVYYELHETMEAAIRREKQVKAWKRLWKIRLIESMNPEWKNLFDPQTGATDFGSSDIEAEEELIIRSKWMVVWIPAFAGMTFLVAMVVWVEAASSRLNNVPSPVIPAKAGIQA